MPEYDGDGGKDQYDTEQRGKAVGDHGTYVDRG